MIDPMTLFDEQAELDRQEDEARVARWIELGKVAKASAARHGEWGVPVAEAISAMDQAADGRIEITDSQKPYVDFAESEGWPNVLRAIARAWDEVENARRRDLERC